MSFVLAVSFVWILVYGPSQCSSKASQTLQKWTSPISKISAILHQDAFLPCETRESIRIDLSASAVPYSVERVDHVNLIHWYRDDSSTPFYTVDGRRATWLEDEDHGLPGLPHDFHAWWRGSKSGKRRRPRSVNTTMFAPGIEVKHRNSNEERYQFDLSRWTPMLKIVNVSEEDEGRYECRVEYAGERTFITEIKLNVFGEFPVEIIN